jgi:hypothetical protein
MATKLPDPQHCFIGSQSKGYKNENGNYKDYLFFIFSGAQYADFWNNNFAIITVSDKKIYRRHL